MALDASIFDQLPQAGNHDAARRLTQDSLRLGQHRHAFEYGIFATGGTPTARGPHGAGGVTTVCRVADRQRLGNAVRLDGGHGIETALNRRAHRRTALSLGGVNSRRCVIEQANTDQLLKRLGRLGQQ